MIKRHGQMSESVPMGIILALTGGYMDAYTYLFRDHVFANAQTGNMILLGLNLSAGEWMMALRYLGPVLAFAVGVFAADRIKWKYKTKTNVHWRQIVILEEALILFGVGFIPVSMNWLANCLVSFACALQVESFRKIRGNSLATTMCIGNLRCATELFCDFLHTKDGEIRKRSAAYYGVIVIFILGAVIGKLGICFFKQKAILVCSVLLFIGFLLMFIKEDSEEDN